MTSRTLLRIAALAALDSSALAQPPPGPPAPSPALAASPSPSPTVAEARQQIVDEIVHGGTLAASVDTIKNPFGSRVSGFQGELVSYLLTIQAGQKVAYRTLLDAMGARAEKQVGSSSTSAGSTSLATKGTVPLILGAAVEDGALERSVSGTTVTFRAKPVGVVKFLQSKNILEVYNDLNRSPGARFGGRFSAAAFFDTSRGSTPGTLTATGDQFGGWSARCEVVNQRDPALSGYTGRWKELLRKAEPSAAAAAKLHDVLSGWAPFTKWQDELTAEVEAKVDAPLRANRITTEKAAEEVKGILKAHLTQLEKLTPLPGEVEAALDQYVLQLTSVEQGIGEIYAFANKGTLLTVEFTTKHDPRLPDLYTGTTVLEAALGAARKTDLTINAEASYYRSLPQGASHQLKGIAFSAEIAHPVGSLLGLRSTTFSVAARYTYLPHDTVASGASTGQPATTSAAAAAPKGSIAVLQAKLIVPLKGSGVKVPLSVTFANRTEIIKEKVVRANFGVTFDLDTLLAASKAGR